MIKGNEIIYQIFVRNYSKEGTFRMVEKDLPRLKELGVSSILVMSNKVTLVIEGQAEKVSAVINNS